MVDLEAVNLPEKEIVVKLLPKRRKFNLACRLCHKRGRYWMKYSKWVEKHFLKYHPGEVIQLRRLE